MVLTLLYPNHIDTNLLVKIMTPIYFTIDDHLPIMAIPNVKVHSDGHTVLTYSYNIFYDRSHEDPELVTANRNIIQDKLNNPDYCSCLAFERHNGPNRSPRLRHRH